MGLVQCIHTANMSTTCDRSWNSLRDSLIAEARPAALPAFRPVASGKHMRGEPFLEEQQHPHGSGGVVSEGECVSAGVRESA